MTVEEHWAVDELGSAVAEAVCSLRADIRCGPVAVADHFATGSVGHGHLVSRNGITAEAVVAHVKTALHAPFSV
ncbi:hypothetical protein [Streptomyces sp. NPDC058280]|uniref:hypothetical protein n=1 Tax=Streptomyces sp. NPDC058280 TaxID=3346419 RepID=UPI0036E039BC